MQCVEWDTGPGMEVTEGPRAQRLWGDSTTHPDRVVWPGHCH